jgi:hypothetical protein
MLLTYCYVCQGNLIPQEQIGLYVCAVCGKEWRQVIIQPTPGMQVFIPGAKHQMGGKSVKQKKGTEWRKKPSVNEVFKRLFVEV